MPRRRHRCDVEASNVELALAPMRRIASEWADELQQRAEVAEADLLSHSWESVLAPTRALRAQLMESRYDRGSSLDAYGMTYVTII